ncbi:hypothetical protein HELRODRAFT_166016 [Helobdella robusta]|uniref:Uncharacterized protein n=1 Tax=Helobdella robusta TaxID=6412 RepID=T1EXL5_HELRO|nr:hypothetical protein HELRODRAFT_166016 [Helobdella robusta]ESN90358.1 hypothetical protein HELRODRAFT_166016 [Helobdella robusta]
MAYQNVNMQTFNLSTNNNPAAQPLATHDDAPPKAHMATTSTCGFFFNSCTAVDMCAPPGSGQSASKEPVESEKTFKSFSTCEVGNHFLCDNNFNKMFNNSVNFNVNNSNNSNINNVNINFNGGPMEISPENESNTFTKSQTQFSEPTNISPITTTSIKNENMVLNFAMTNTSQVQPPTAHKPIKIKQPYDVISASGQAAYNCNNIIMAYHSTSSSSFSISSSSVSSLLTTQSPKMTVVYGSVCSSGLNNPGHKQQLPSTPALSSLSSCNNFWDLTNNSVSSTLPPMPPTFSSGVMSASKCQSSQPMLPPPPASHHPPHHHLQQHFNSFNASNKIMDVNCLSSNNTLNSSDNNNNNTNSNNNNNTIGAFIISNYNNSVSHDQFQIGWHIFKLTYPY